jgi:hypothetical protein
MAAPASPRWKVTTQVPKVGLVNGRAVDGVQVNFQTHHGTIDSVFVANSDFSPAHVKAAIEARFAALDAIHGLSG